jgi:hypothetical protein
MHGLTILACLLVSEIMRLVQNMYWSNGVFFISVYNPCSKHLLLINIWNVTFKMYEQVHVVYRVQCRLVFLLF